MIVLLLSRCLAFDSVTFSAGMVSIVTNDGRHIVGTLRGYDQATNVIVDESVERIYREDAGAETIALGLYVVRGDTIAIIGELDE